LLIVEAKAKEKSFVTPSPATIDRSGARNAMDGGPSLIARAVDHVNKGEAASSSPVTLEWTRWIAKLRDYVKTVHENSGYCAQRVVITSGQWLVIFCNPAAAFLEDGAATDSGVLCFSGDELLERSDQIHDLLARETLIRDPPERLRPTQLTAYLAPSDVAHVFCALWIVHRVDGAYFDVHPSSPSTPRSLFNATMACLLRLSMTVRDFPSPTTWTILANIRRRSPEMRRSSSKL